MSFKRRVFFRIFPTEKSSFDCIKIDQKCNKIYVRHLQELSKQNTKADPTYWEFQTSGVFFNSTQETVYKEVKEGVLENVMNGYNAVILAFGQTGTGKTFTTSGLHLAEEEFGILPRIAKDLLESRKQEPNNIKICIQMSYVEFYNTYAVDLLRKLPKAIETYKCRDVKRVKILNEFDALKCIFIGEGRKNFLDQNCQYLSNLSTSVATFHIIRKNMDLTNPIKVYSKLHVVDMAGNDSCANITHFFKNPKQIGLANITKLQLEQFILCLTENIPQNIKTKQRINALMYYLNGDLSEESILRFIGHIRVKTEDLVITLSMLRFGNLVQGLKMKKSVIQFDINEEMEVAYLRGQLQTNENEKHLNSVLLNQDLVSGMNPERLIHLNNLIQDYLRDGIQEITVMNVADTELVLRHMKEICNGYQIEIKSLQAEKETLMAQQKSDTSVKSRNSKSSSQSSGSKISRKSSKSRSKDSVAKEKRTSSISEKRLKTSGSDEAAAVEMPYTSPKRKKSFKSYTMNMLTKQSATSKRKSSNTSIDKRDSRASVKSIPPELLQLPIPDLVPEKQDMWRRFNSNAAYKERVDEYKQNEKDVRNTFLSYIREIKKLQNCKIAVDKCTNELLLAQTYRKFNSKDQYDRNGILAQSFAEQECKDNIEEAQESLLEQQEKALTSQEMFKVYLENRKSILNRVQDEFNQFCVDNYRLPSDDLESVQIDFNRYTFDVNLDQYDAFEQEEEIMNIPEVPQTAQNLRFLQRLMSNERKKTKQIVNKKKNEWKNY